MNRNSLKFVLAVIVIGVTAAVYFSRSNNENSVSSPAQRATEVVKTAKGPIEVGGTAFMDGRDPEAAPPLTLMNINVWDSFNRSRPVCSVNHGSEVSVLSSHWKSSENRYYFQINGPNQCSGWVPESFLSSQYHTPIGDRM